MWASGEQFLNNIQVNYLNTLNYLIEKLTLKMLYNILY